MMMGLMLTAAAVQAAKDWPEVTNFMATDAKAAAAWQEGLRQGLWGWLMGGKQPKRRPLAPELVRLEQRDKFDLWQVTYRTRADRTNKALLAVPHGTRRAPALLALHGHEAMWGEADIGAFAPGHPDDFCGYFAERGYVVMQPATMNHALQNPQWTLQGEWTWDALRGLDYLLSRPDVEPGRVSVIGLSTGAMLAIECAALDTRLKACVAGGFFTTWNHIRTRLKIPPHCDCGITDQISDRITITDLCGLVAPRSLMIMLGREDTEFFPGADPSKLDPKWQTAVMVPEEFEDALAALKRIYAVVGTPDRLVYHVHPGGHSIDNEAAYRFVEERVGGNGR
jgi:hypothetical protein